MLKPHEFLCRPNLIFTATNSLQAVHQTTKSSEQSDFVEHQTCYNSKSSTLAVQEKLLALFKSTSIKCSSTSWRRMFRRLALQNCSNSTFYLHSLHIFSLFSPNCICCLSIKADVICLQLPNDMKMTTGADWEMNNSH